MKYLMVVGDQLDLAVSYDGGAVDAVTYIAPDAFANKVGVNASGVVTALGLGDGLVYVFSGGVQVGTIAFEVLAAGAYAARQGIRNGSKTFVVGATAVPQGPPPSAQISLNSMTAASQGGYTAFGQLISWSQPWNAFNGNLSIQNEYQAVGALNPGGIITIGQILPEVKALTSVKVTTPAYRVFPQFTIECSTDTTTGLNGTWATIFTSEQYPIDGLHPSYLLADGVVLTQLTPDGNNNVLTKTFTVANFTGFKAYRLKMESSDISRIVNFNELVFYGY